MINRFLSESLRDMRYGVRQLAQHRSFTIVTIFILALGIGATTAIGFGSVVAFWASRFVASLLYQIDPHDTRIMAAVAFALLIAAAVAVWLPAARISRTDPATVLKAE